MKKLMVVFVIVLVLFLTSLACGEDIITEKGKNVARRDFPSARGPSFGPLERNLEGMKKNVGPLRGRGFMGGRGMGPGFGPGPGFRGGFGREVIPGINKKEVNDEKIGMKKRAEVKRPALIGRRQRPQFRNFAPMGRGRGFQCQRNCQRQRGFLMHKNDGRRSFKRVERLVDKDKRERSLKGSGEKLYRGDSGRKGFKKGIRKETGRRGEFKGEFKGRNSKTGERKRPLKK